MNLEELVKFLELFRDKENEKRASITVYNDGSGYIESDFSTIRFDNLETLRDKIKLLCQDDRDFDFMSHYLQDYSIRL